MCYGHLIPILSPPPPSTIMSTKRPIYVFDHVRSNSQLFNKLFAAHPELEQIFMPLMGASLYGPEGVFRGRKHSDTTEGAFNDLAEPSGAAATETFKVATERLDGAVASVQEKVRKRSGVARWSSDLLIALRAKYHG